MKDKHPELKLKEPEGSGRESKEEQDRRDRLREMPIMERKSGETISMKKMKNKELSNYYRTIVDQIKRTLQVLEAVQDECIERRFLVAGTSRQERDKVVKETEIALNVEVDIPSQESTIKKSSKKVSA